MIIRSRPFYEDYNNTTYYTIVIFTTDSYSLIQPVDNYVYTDIIVKSNDNEYAKMLQHSKFGG